MKITFLGATDTVTGSCYLLETDNQKILIDCGMFRGNQELEERNYAVFDFNPKEINLVVLTHAHIDHCGLLPKLAKDGFRGKIFSTSATQDLCGILLPDSAHIQEEDIEWKNRKRQRAGKNALNPLYTKKDAIEVLKYFLPIPYRKPLKLTDSITLTFFDAGHILGAAFIELIIQEKHKEKKLIFSGDLGNKDQRIVCDTDQIASADYVFLESTYGDRLHKSRNETIKEFRSILEKSIKTGGNVIIPAFAVERTQEILYELHEMIERGFKIDVPIFIDSPLAISATEIFKKHKECFDKEMWQLLISGKNPFDFKNLHFTNTAEESKKINLFERSIIISASGMCDAGRIRHHLKHNLWKPNAHIIFTGFQAIGSLGRKIIDGAKIVKLFNEDIAVKAHIHTLGGFSAHADQKELIEWLSKIPQKPQKIFLVHGEDKTRLALENKIKQELQFVTHLPKWKESIEL